MKTCTQSKNGQTNGDVHRYILVVDDGVGVANLMSAWHQLQLSDELRVVTDSDRVISLLREPVKVGVDRIAAVVLDPNTAGAGADAFLRRALDVIAANPVPMLVWSRDDSQHAPLEASDRSSRIPKSMVLRLIHALDDACGLRHESAPMFV